MLELSGAWILGIMSVVITAIAGIFVALIQKLRTPAEAIVLEAGALDHLGSVVSDLSAALSKETAARREDRVRITRIVAECESAIRVSQEENKAQISQLRLYYERKMGRMEQAHRDRVNALKGRIRVLEDAVGNGNGRVV